VVVEVKLSVDEFAVGAVFVTRMDFVTVSEMASGVDECWN